MRKYPSKAEPATIKTWEIEDGDITVPRGGMSRVREILKAAGFGYSVIDARKTGYGVWPGFHWPKHKLTLRPDQEQLVAAMRQKENCLIKSGTGSGKTCSAIGLISRLQLPTIVVVWEGGLFGQWVDRLKSELGMDDRWIGKIRGSKKVIGPITVAMQQTIARIKDPNFFDRWGVLVFDEVHRAAAKTYFASVDPFSSKYRIGISADEKRKDGKVFLTNDLFGDVAAEVSHDDLVRSGAILDVKVIVVPTDFQAPWYTGQGDLEYTRLMHEMSQDVGRNSLVLRETQALIRQGRKCLVFGRLREHCMEVDRELAARGEQTGLLIGGEDYREAYKETRDSLSKGSLMVGVGTVQAVGTGIDIPILSGGVAMTPLSTNKQLFGQVRGRLCRTAQGKQDAVLVVLWDRHVFGVQHLKNLRAWANHVVVRQDDGTEIGVDDVLRAMRPA